jgi:hypothetical protein
MRDAIVSRHYKYIVMKYPPTIPILEAIQASGYEQIAPGAWVRLPAAPAPAP